MRPGLYLADLLGLALTMAILVRIRGSRLRWGYRRITVPLLMIVVLAILTAPAAISPTLAGYTAFRWLIAAIIYVTLLQVGAFLEQWVAVFVIGLGLQALIGFAQVMKQGPLGLHWELALYPSQSGASILTIGGTRWLRAYGLTVHPNVLGGFLAMGLLLSLPLLNRRYVRILWLLIGLGLLLTFSRSASLAVALVLPLLAVWMARRHQTLRRPLAVTLGGALLILLFGGALLAGQLASRLRPTSTPTEARSLSERGELIAVAMEIIADKPLTGVGAGNFPLAMLNTDRRARPQPVHNVPLLLAAEVGAAGALLWVLLWLAPALALDRRRHRVGLWTVTLVGAWFAWGIIGLWDGYPWTLNVGPYFSATVLALTSHVLEAQ